MATTIVEFDSLPDAIGATAKDHDSLTIGRLGRDLVFILIRGIVIGRVGFELCGARIDRLEGCADSAAQSVAASRIVKIAQRLAVVALSWIVPVNTSLKPKACRIQSTMTSSISVAAGEVCHNMHIAEIELARCSASTLAGDAIDWK